MTESLKHKIGKTMAKTTVATQLAVLTEQVRSIDETVREIKKKMEDDYVTQDQFKPVKALVFGFAGLILTAVVGALVALVVRQ